MEEEQKEQRKAQARQRRKDLALANQKVAAIRQETVALHAEEDVRIDAHNQKKRDQEIRRREDKDRIRDENTAMRDKIRRRAEARVDRQVQLDEERDKRYNEARQQRELKKRQRERKNKDTAMVEVMNARQKQIMDKARRTAMEANLEREDFEGRLGDIEQYHREEQAKVQSKLDKRNAYARILKRQMQGKDRSRSKHRDSYLQARQKTPEALVEKMEREKHSRLESIRAAGVPEKYLSKLKDLNIKD